MDKDASQHKEKDMMVCSKRLGGSESVDLNLEGCLIYGEGKH